MTPPRRRLFLTAWMLAAALIWWLGAFRAALRWAADERLRLGANGARAPHDVLASVIMPVRNERVNIAGAVASVLAQDHPRLELIVVDDGSTDGTREYLSGIHDDRLTVLALANETPPAPWLGKPWACAHGAARAGGEWLLFVDADARLAACAVSRTLAHAIEHELALLSAIPALELGSIAERIVQPAIMWLLVIAGHSLATNSDPRRRDAAFASGPYMLARRADYELVGGHSAVCAEQLDDVALAAEFKRWGLRYHLLFAPELLSVRFYRGAAELHAGWRRTLYSAAGRSPLRVGAALAGALGLVAAPCATVGVAVCRRAGSGPFAAAVAALMGMHASRFVVDRLLRENVAAGAATQLTGVAALAFLLADSALHSRRRGVLWKGRHLRHPPRVLVRRA